METRFKPRQSVSYMPFLIFVKSLSHDDSLWPHGRRSHPMDVIAIRLRCPWDFPGKNTGVGCHFLLQGIFPTQVSNPGLLHCRPMLHRLRHQGRPYLSMPLNENNIGFTKRRVILEHFYICCRFSIFLRTKPFYPPVISQIKKSEEIFYLKKQSVST